MSVTTAGTVSRRSGSRFLIDALFSKIQHTVRLDDETLYRLLTNSIIKNFIENNLEKPDNILAALQKECIRLQNNENTYTLITSINHMNSSSLKNRTLNGCKISFHNSVPLKYKKSRLELANSNPNIELNEQANFTFVRISSKAANHHSAFSLAMETLDLYRAISQLTSKRSPQVFSDTNEGMYPSGSILSIGQFHTLHHANGKHVEYGLWHEPNYRTPKLLKTNNPTQSEKNKGILIGRLHKSNFSEFLTTRLIGYVRATDCLDHSLRFMMLWAAAEKIVGTDDSAKAISRLCFFYEDQSLQKSILESLRSARHANIHGGKRPFNIEMKNFQLASFLVHTLLFMLHNPFKHQTIIDFFNFINTRITNIDRDIQNLKLVKKFTSS
jgi:hypothetical protein